MLHTLTPNTRRRVLRHGVLFPHITAAAAEFGVSRVLLYRVLKGQLPDHHKLKPRYSSFVTQRNAAPQPHRKFAPCD